MTKLTPTQERTITDIARDASVFNVTSKHRRAQLIAEAVLKADDADLANRAALDLAIFRAVEDGVPISRIAGKVGSTWATVSAAVDRGRAWAITNPGWTPERVSPAGPAYKFHVDTSVAGRIFSFIFQILDESGEETRDWALIEVEDDGTFSQPFPGDCLSFERAEKLFFGEDDFYREAARVWIEQNEGVE